MKLNFFLQGEKSLTNHWTTENRSADLQEQPWTGNPSSTVGLRGPVTGIADNKSWPEWESEHSDGTENIHCLYDRWDWENE